MKKKRIISGTGCCLVDRIYPDIDFLHPDVAKYISAKQGDGGIHPGRLVFSEPFEAYCGRSLQSAVDEISRGSTGAVLNVGGPSIVALIHAAQLLHESDAVVCFCGTRGDDPAGEFLQSQLDRTPVQLKGIKLSTRATPSTIVLSDPSYHGGHGERAFINQIGAAWEMEPSDLEDGFFEADVVAFGGTALVPHLHDHLTGLLKRARQAGCLTVVNTVYDFRSEISAPGRRWPLGEDGGAYPFIDLLVTDREEALHLSGAPDLETAGKFFMERGVSAFLITSGTEDTLAWSDNRRFKPLPMNAYPVSQALVSDLNGFKGGDTTGCGDNFAGGILASLAWQLNQGKDTPDLEECIAWGTVSGGYCCFHVGGTFLEREPGELLERIKPYYFKYLEQIHG
jgi:sugar/nucleoside kinase (ribokinase family)